MHRSLPIALSLCGTAAWIASTACAQRPTLDEIHRALPMRTHALSEGVAGDVDRDGFADLVLARRLGDKLVWLGRPDGRLVALEGAIAWDGDAVAEIALVDLDGDLDLDLVAANDARSCQIGGPQCTGARNRWWRNDGTGRFTDASALLPADDAVRSRSVAAGDVDGDRDIDLVFGVAPHVWSIYPNPTIHVERPQDRLFLNAGNGTFVEATQNLPAAIDSTSVVRLGDLDGDGDLDLWKGTDPITGVASGDDVVYRNDGSGRFSAIPGALPVDGLSVRGGALFDVDADADLDLAVLDDGGLRLLLNRGDATFQDGTARVAGWPNDASELFAGDWDRDGDSDLACITRAGTFAILRNAGAGTFTLDPATQRTPLRGLGVAFDAGADRDLDLLAYAGLGEVLLLWNDGRGGLSDVSHDASTSYIPTVSCVAGDLNGDGRAEMVIAGLSAAANAVYQRDPEDRWTLVNAGALSTDLGDTEEIELADLDGDGDLDAVLASFAASMPGTSAICWNQGGGIFALATGALPAMSSIAVEVGDLDRDGALDLYFGSLMAPDRVFLGRNGVFTEVSGAVTVSGNSFDVELADVDGDGILDAILARYSAMTNKVLRGDGTGRFHEMTGALTPDPAEDTMAVASGDVDGDGDADLVFGNDGGAAPQSNRLYLNDGTGRFTEASATQWPLDRGRTADVLLEDDDADGDVDAAIANFTGSERSRLYRNDGAGRFARDPLAMQHSADHATALTAADLDGDADLDLFLAGHSRPQVLVNHALQLQWRSAPRLGHPLVLDLDGAPNAAYLLAASAGLVRFPLPGLGDFRLAPSSYVLVHAGQLDAQGTRALSFAVPSSPALLGVPVYWQALLGPTLRLTNLEVTRFRNL